MNKSKIASKSRSPIKVVFTRHADRHDARKTGLNREGLRRAVLYGRELAAKHPKNKLKSYSSARNRVLTTARLARNAFANHKKAVYSPIRVRKDLTTPVLRKEEFEHVVKSKYGGDLHNAMIGWFKGEISSEIITPCETIAQEVIRKRVGLGQRAAKKGMKKIILNNFTHREIMVLVLAKLLGESPVHFAQNNDIKYAESAKLELFKNGKALLYFRSTKPIDVSARLKELLKK